jgi:hypothetical protein
MTLNKVIIWGFPLNTHTHSYIHYGWHKTFKYLGYDTYWFDDKNYPSSSEFDYTNCLFITEGYADNNIPIDKSNTYFVHVCIYPNKYIKTGARLIDIRYNVTGIRDCNYNYNLDEKIENNIVKLIDGSTVNYYEDVATIKDLNIKYQSEELKSLTYEAVYMCWATDLLPHEINYEDRFIKPDLPPKMYFIGSIGDGNINEINNFVKGCSDNNIRFEYNDPWKNPITFNDVQKLVQKSYIAPDIRGSGDRQKIMLNETGTMHKEIGYIPCRLFKNISYGKVGGVNAHRLHKLFQNKVLYHNDEKELVKLCIENRENYDYILEQMKWVAENHTYVNRVNDILKVLEYKNQVLNKIQN